MVSMLSFIEYKDNCVFMFKDTNSVFIRRYKLIPFSVLCNDYTTLLSSNALPQPRGNPTPDASIHLLTFCIFLELAKFFWSEGDPPFFTHLSWMCTLEARERVLFTRL